MGFDNSEWIGMDLSLPFINLPPGAFWSIFELWPQTPSPRPSSTPLPENTIKFNMPEEGTVGVSFDVVVAFTNTRIYALSNVMITLEGRGIRVD